MFEVGKRYRFKMWEPGPNGGKITESASVQVDQVDLPLVKISGMGREIVVNTASISFVSATEAIRE